MKVVLEGVTALSDGIWLVSIEPHQVAKLGAVKSTDGQSSVVQCTSPSFDSGRLSMAIDDLVVLNLGVTARTIIVDRSLRAIESGHQSGKACSPGKGDGEFLTLIESCLNGEAAEAAYDLLRQVRSRWPGELKRGERNNFSETPDNFWYVVVQPRKQSLSITVRGNPDRFQSANFELRPDRPGYTRFQLSNPDDVAEVIRIIDQSKRRL